MQTTGVRDLHDWITGFGSLQVRMRAKLASPAPDYHLRENHTREIGVQEIAEAAGVSPFVLKRLFDESLGADPGQYLLQLRMQSAESLLAAGARSLPEIAQAVGFGDQGYLIAHQDRKSSAAY